MLFAFFGTWDLVIIAFIAMLLFGNRLPGITRSLGQGVDNLRCRHCGWRSFSPFYCMHCGRRKYLLFMSPDSAAAADDGRAREVRFPRWVLALVILAGLALAADCVGNSAAEVSPEVAWRFWWHWATLALVAAAILSIITAIV